MKLKNYTLALLAVCALTSCGEEDIPKIEVPDLTPDATLSIAAIPDGKTGLRAATKAEADVAVKPSETIDRLTVLVFSASGAFQSMADTVAAAGSSLTEIKNVNIKSGVIKVLLIANRDMNTAKGKSLEQVLAMTTTLDQETHKPATLLTMSSQVFDCAIVRGKHNLMGYGASSADPNNNNILVADAVKMYRSVARVQVSSLTLKENTDFGVAQSFVIDSVFVANVKSISKIASAAAGGTLESTILKADEANQWWTGGCPNFTGTYKKIEKETEQSYLAYSFSTPPTHWNMHPYYDTTREGIQGGFALNNSTRSKTDALGIGNFFYVYENSRMDGATSMMKDGTQTLLVLKGTYSYIPKGTTDVKTVANCYYTAIVNDGIGTTYDSEVSKHTGIRRNYQYNLAITIAGPGSDNPYEKDAWASVTAGVEVLPWGVIKINDPDAN